MPILQKKVQSLNKKSLVLLHYSHNTLPGITDFQIAYNYNFDALTSFQ